MKVSIIIPNYNGGQYLLDCLRSIYVQDPKPYSLEIILVDNASKDNSQTRAKKEFPKIKLIQFQKNKGFAKAVNAGIKKAKGNFIFILNNDTLLEKNCLQGLIKTFEKDKKIGVVGGKINNPQGKLDLPGFKLNPYLGFMIYDSKGKNQAKEIDWVSGSAMMVQKEVLQKIGLLDEKFFFYFEDTDFCLRAKRAGYKIFYQPMAKIVHLGGLASKEVNKAQLNQYWYRGKFRCILKNGTPLQIVSSLLAQVLVFPYKVWIKRDGTGQAQIKGLLWNLKQKKIK